MKISMVTISYNQSNFLERTLKSVLVQDGVELEYIVVDPGSTDGSRGLIQTYADRLAHMVFEPDQGPADGLNRGFARATGDVFGYLNSDDTLEPGALRKVADFFERHPEVDVACGHAWAIDGNDVRLRRLWSMPFERLPVAFGEAVQIQPSTFIRAAAFRRAGGFNVANKSNWDGELLIDLHRTGARFALMPDFLSCYRLHAVSITNSGRLDGLIRQWEERRFELLMQRAPRATDRLWRAAFRLLKHARNPQAALERLLHGPVYRRGVQ